MAEGRAVYTTTGGLSAQPPAKTVWSQKEAEKRAKRMNILAQEMGLSARYEVGADKE